MLRRMTNRKRKTCSVKCEHNGVTQSEQDLQSWRWCTLSLTKKKRYELITLYQFFVSIMIQNLIICWIVETEERRNTKLENFRRNLGKLSLSRAKKKKRTKKEQKTKYDIRFVLFAIRLLVLRLHGYLPKKIIITNFYFLNNFNNLFFNNKTNFWLYSFFFYSNRSILEIESIKLMKEYILHFL